MRRLHEEIKCIGILEHPDIRCACCGLRIRMNATDRDGAGDTWFPAYVGDEDNQVLRAQLINNAPDGELHYSFALDDEDLALGVAQDDVCSQKTVRCSLHRFLHEVVECDPKTVHGRRVVRIYMDDRANNPIFAGTLWHRDRWPTDDEVALTLKRWRGAGGPEFVVEWEKE